MLQVRGLQQRPVVAREARLDDLRQGLHTHSRRGRGSHHQWCVVASELEHELRLQHLTLTTADWLERPFIEFLEEKKLSPRLQSFVLYSIARLEFVQRADQGRT